MLKNKYYKGIDFIAAFLCTLFIVGVLSFLLGTAISVNSSMGFIYAFLGWILFSIVYAFELAAAFVINQVNRLRYHNE
jgi:hypothetical protein